MYQRSLLAEVVEWITWPAEGPAELIEFWHLCLPIAHDQAQSRDPLQRRQPAAKRSSETLARWFQEQGWEVCVAPNWGGILGYAKPDSPICLTKVDSLAPLDLIKP
jgi:hypothetical protein